LVLQPIRQAVQDWSLATEDSSSSAAHSSSGGAAAFSAARQDLHVADRINTSSLACPRIAKPDSKVVKERCGCAIGDWCGRYEAQTPVPAKPPPRGTRQCLWGNDTIQCNWVGESGCREHWPVQLEVWCADGSCMWHIRRSAEHAVGRLPTPTLM
jgi:hypothetical protein